MSASGTDREALAAFADAAAALIALPIDPRFRADVVDHLARLVAAAELLEEFPLPEDVEVAPVFRA
jgi:hypothetical protein